MEATRLSYGLAMPEVRLKGNPEIAAFPASPNSGSSINFLERIAVE
jgi:hypothetical protein